MASLAGGATRGPVRCLDCFLLFALISSVVLNLLLHFCFLFPVQNNRRAAARVRHRGGFSQVWPEKTHLPLSLPSGDTESVVVS